MKNIITTLAVLALSSAFTFAVDEKPADPKPADPAKPAEPAKPEKKDAFAMKDADNDGSISKAEYVGTAKDAAAKRLETQFGKLDKDADGKLSKEEFASKGGKAPAKKKDS